MPRAWYDIITYSIVWPILGTSLALVGIAGYIYSWSPLRAQRKYQGGLPLGIRR